MTVGLSREAVASSKPDGRDPWLDNAKMVLVTLVVVGHSWTMLPTTTLNHHLYAFLYAWHMPAFVLLSGYLSRSMRWTRARITNAVTTLLVPYVIFELALGTYRNEVGHDHLQRLVLNPHWPMWFLVALFCWRMMTPALLAVPPYVAIAVAVAASLLIGHASTEIFDVERVLGMLPFFVVGLVLTPARLYLLRTRAVQIGAAVAVVAVGVATWNLDSWAGTQWLYFDVPYADLGAHPWPIVVTRIATIVLGVVGALAFLSLVPRRRSMLTAMGAQSLVVYLFHGFVIKSVYYLGYPDWLDAHRPAWAWLATTSAAVLLALFLACAPVSRVLGWGADPVGKVRAARAARSEVARIG
ncbi:acyltransferase family protein [Nocardioides montaniterrae]